jgi:hypothetical protein
LSVFTQTAQQVTWIASSRKFFMEPLDLRNKPPRSCHAELDGLMLVPRTIDKLRAQLPGGEPGIYFINGKIKGISGYLLDRLGISEADLLESVRLAASQYRAINATLRRIKPKHAEDEAYFRSEYAETIEEHPELEFIVDIVDADDRRRFGV